MPSLAFDVILLAAGLSRRMGSKNKLLLPVNNAPLIARTAALYCELGMQVTAVLGHQSEAVASALAGLPLNTVFNADFATGQDSSIRAGLAAITLGETGLIMALGDQPLLESQDISALCEAFLSGPRNKILVPYFNAQRGHPVLLPALIAAEIKAGAALPRAFMAARPDRVARYDAPNTHYTTDLDTPEDVARVLGKEG